MCVADGAGALEHTQTSCLATDDQLYHRPSDEIALCEIQKIAIFTQLHTLFALSNPVTVKNSLLERA